MLVKERQEKIKDLIQKHRNLKMSELSRMLGVSEMTVHRDVKHLVNEGFVIKTFGGISLVNKETRDNPKQGNACIVCGRTLQERFSYRIILSNTEVESACCSHCGLLRQHQLRDAVVQAICYDFLTHTTISALSAWFVVDAGIDIHCCQPQLLAFGSREYAERFVKGFGGTVVPIEVAMAQVCSKMKPTSGCIKHD